MLEWLWYGINIIVVLFILFLLFWRFIFLRNPPPSIPKGNVVVAPAEGIIVNIISLTRKNPLLKKGPAAFRTSVRGFEGGHLIQIMLNIHNIHYQRAPTGGTVSSIIYTKGKFMNAVKNLTLDALENERNEIVLEHKTIGEVKVIQLAGFVARRIECFVKKNQTVKTAEVLGRINMGSQVCLVLPKGVALQVKVGQKVFVGETIMGVY
ncbi:phosphatidylserine decarboxylase [Candidatus Woesearchaeota archaeon]|nr:phosphatidylserine decarboxylase [Candidatus Woesearchaeota archaeon]